MILGHLGHTLRGVDYDHAVIGMVGRYRGSSGVEVLLLAAQVEDSDQLSGVVEDVLPSVGLLSEVLRWDHLSSLAVIAHQVVTQSLGGLAGRYFLMD